DALGRWFDRRFNWETPVGIAERRIDGGLLVQTPVSSFGVSGGVDRCFRYLAESLRPIETTPDVRNYRPSGIDEILQRKYADPLDGARMLATLMAAQDMHADIVVYPRDRRRMASDVPVLDGMDGIAVVVSGSDGREIWLDPANFCGPAGWFFHGAGVRGIRFSQGRAVPVELPVPPAGVSVSRRDVRMNVQHDGSAIGELEWSVSGDYAAAVLCENENRSLRERFQAWSRELNRGVFPMTLAENDLSNNDTLHHMTLHFHADWAGLITGDMMVVTVTDIPIESIRRDAPPIPPGRMHSIDLGSPALETLTVEYRFPDEYEILAWPSDQKVVTGDVVCLQRIEKGDHTIRLRRQIRWLTPVVTPKACRSVYDTISHITGESENLILLRKR
ncbi:hypothetical protein JXA80_01885, partial [bacterium]|nr:hypothetical protein [candidate division CSSED10-310 bacterium]